MPQQTNSTDSGILTIMHMEVQTTRHYGSTSVTLTMGGNFEIDSAEKRDKIYDKLSYEVQVQHDRYAEKYLRNETLAASNTGKQVSQNDKVYEDVIFDTIEKTMWKGKLMAKVRFGKFQKYGVSMYPEHFEKYIEDLNFNDEGFADGDGWIATVEYVNGDPKRVTKLSKTLTNTSESE